MAGGRALLGQGQGDSLGEVGTPELEHLLGSGEDMDWTEAGGVSGLQEPTSGKGGRNKSEVHTGRERKEGVSDMARHIAQLVGCSGYLRGWVYGCDP